MGYHRADSKVGSANYWLFIPLVFGESHDISVFREALAKELGYDRTRSYDFDVRSLVQKHQKGASEEDILTSDIVITTEQMSNQRFFRDLS